MDLFDVVEYLEADCSRPQLHVLQSAHVSPHTCLNMHSSCTHAAQACCLHMPSPCTLDVHCCCLSCVYSLACAPASKVALNAYCCLQDSTALFDGWSAPAHVLACACSMVTLTPGIDAACDCSTEGHNRGRTSFVRETKKGSVHAA